MLITKPAFVLEEHLAEVNQARPMVPETSDIEPSVVLEPATLYFEASEEDITKVPRLVRLPNKLIKRFIPEEIVESNDAVTVNLRVKPADNKRKPPIAMPQLETAVIAPEGTTVVPEYNKNRPVVEADHLMGDVIENESFTWGEEDNNLFADLLKTLDRDVLDDEAIDLLVNDTDVRGETEVAEAESSIESTSDISGALDGRELFLDNITETHEVLLSIIRSETEEDEEQEPDIFNDVSSMEQIQEEPVLLLKAIASEQIVVVEQFLALKLEGEDKTSLADVIDMGQKEKPLEETLVNLIVYLAEAPQEEAPILRQLLLDIQNEIYISKEELGGQKLANILTQDLTTMLLKLLSELGYQDPAHALFGFFAEQDLSTMFKAIEYLNLLSNPNYRKEFHHSLVTSDDDQTMDEVPRSIFSVVTNREVGLTLC